MFSRILIKLIDEAIIPAVTLVAARFVSVVLIAKYSGISFNVGLSGISYNSHNDFVFVNSYSILIMICALLLGLFYVLIKAHVLHASHIKPHTSAKMVSLKLGSFIQTSFDIYSQGVIWWMYLLLMFFATVVMNYFNLIHMWVMWVSLVATLVTIYFLIIDVEREIEINKK